MDDKKIKISPISAVLAGMLLIYFGMVCAINLSGVPGFYDADMYTDMRYAMEAWEHKSVFPQGWVFGNQLYVASTPVVAALFYGLTGVPHLAMGLASSLMTLLVLLSFQWMLKPVMKTHQARLAGSVLFMAVMLFFGDAWHDTGGWQLLFTMCSYYACYAVNVFLAYGSYLRSQRRISVCMWIIFPMTCLLSFCTGIQSLRQTAVMTLPLLGVECLRLLQCMIRRKVPEKRPAVVAGMISVANLAGLVTARCLNLEQVEIIGEMKLVSLSEYLPNIRTGIGQAMSLVINYDVPGYIVLGIIMLVCIMAAVFLIMKAVYEQDQRGLTLIILLIFSVLAILAVDVMTTMLVRPIYYFMLFPLLGCFCAGFFECGGRWGRVLLTAFLVVLFSLSCIRELPDIAVRIWEKDEDSATEVSNYLLGEGYTTVYGAWNQGADIVIASDWQIKAGFWEDTEDPFFFYKYLCNPEIFRADSETCVYLFYGKENAQLAVDKARTKNISLTLLKHFPESDIYLYTAPVNLMEAFW